MAFPVFLRKHVAEWSLNVLALTDEQFWHGLHHQQSPLTGLGKKHWRIAEQCPDSWCSTFLGRWLARARLGDSARKQSPCSDQSGKKSIYWDTFLQVSTQVYPDHPDPCLNTDATLQGMPITRSLFFGRTRAKVSLPWKCSCTVRICSKFDCLLLSSGSH